MIHISIVHYTDREKVAGLLQGQDDAYGWHEPVPEHMLYCLGTFVLEISGNEHERAKASYSGSAG